MLLPLPPSAGVLRALLAAQLRMAALASRAAFGRLFGGMLGGQCESVPVGWGGRRGRFPRRAQQLTGVELRESTTVAGRPLSMPMGWVTSLAEEIDREAALSGRVRH